jgi:hypothetical protein
MRIWPAPASAATVLPRLVVIGAQKAGTTALTKYLAQHPQFLPPRVKEVNYFGCPPRYSNGPRWYASHWRRTRGARVSHTQTSALRFEASPHYMRASHAAAQLHESLADVRLIALLRDPVERAYSAWKMYRWLIAHDPNFFAAWNRKCYAPEDVAALQPRTQSELEDFGLAVEREAACLERGHSMVWSLLEYGFYGSQLQRYLELFPRGQLLILQSDDLKFRRGATLDHILEFVGLAPWDWSRADLSLVFASTESAPMPKRAHDFLREYYLASNRMLRGMLEPLPDWAAA